MIKHFSFVLLAFLWASVAFAQKSTMQRFIAQERLVFVVNMHPSSTYNKLNKETKDKYRINELIAPILLKFSSGQPSEKEIKKVSEQLSDPSKVGINVKDDIYIWGQRPKAQNERSYTASAMENMIISMVIPVTDNKKFKNFLSNIIAESQQKEIITAGSNSTMVNNEVIVTWNNERVILSSSTLEHNFFEDRKDFEERRNKTLLQHASDLTKVDPKKSIENNKSFKASLDKEADINFWGDYGKLVLDPSIMPMEMRGLFTALSKLTDNTILSGQAYFKNGEAEIKTSMSLNPPMKRVTDAAYNKRKVNKKFFKYIDKTNLMGMYSFSMDLKSFMMAYGQEIHKVLKEQDTKETRIAMNMMDIMDIFLDEEETYELLTGDMMIALTDMRVVKREVADFKYNEESNSWEEEIEMVDGVVPIMSLMLSCGNEVNIRHFIDLGVNVGELVKKQEGVWMVPAFKEDLGTDFYIILKDGTLIMTNDDQIAKNVNGLPVTKQLSPSSVTELSNYVMYGMLDATQISRVAKKAYAQNKENVPNDIMELEKIFSKMEFKSITPENKDFQTNFYCRMKDENTNALQFLLDYVENMINQTNNGSSEKTIPYEEEDEEEEGVKRL